MSDRFRISSVLPLQLDDHGISTAAVLRRAGLPAGLFEQEKVVATTAELFALWRAVGEESGDPAIGLVLGTEPRLERYNPTTLAAVCSRSFRDALGRMARFKRMTCPEEIRVRSSRGDATVEFVFPEAVEEEPRILVDVCLSWILAIGRRGTDDRLRPVRVELARPARHREVFEEHYGCRVHFGAKRNALVFRDGDLDLPFTTRNPELLQAILVQLETELEEHDAPPGIDERVRRLLRRTLAGSRPTLAEIARDLCMSARTLQRRLTDVGVTFQQVVEETRRELAHHYLAQPEVELKETAYLLGFEDSNSFFRAFQSWEGTSPGEWRARLPSLPSAR